ncbi:MAG: ATP-binding protein [Acidobacteriota bacterium]|nr:ATP-binding protein [Acidobacteriota bacterium]
MDPIRNPYTPGAGSRPPALTGRDSELEAFRVLLARLALGRPEKSMLITGLRGVGKTVLLNTFEAIAEEQGFRTAKAEITHETDFRPLIARLARRALLAISPARRMKQRARRAAAVFKAFTLRTPEGLELGIDVEALVGQADSGELGEDLSDLFQALGEAAQEHKTGVVFLLDEIQFLARPELEALIAALHQVSQRELPLTLTGAGLPQLPALTGAAKSYAERLFRFPSIDRLDPQAGRAALELPAEQEGVSFQGKATDRILELTDGYPYFLQEYGKHAWNAAAGPTINIADVRRAHDLVQLELDESFFRVRIGRATRAELDYLAAMAGLGQGPYRSGEIATALGRPGPESVAPTRARLIEKGLIYSPAYGLNEFTVPHFDTYLRRTVAS